MKRTYSIIALPLAALMLAGCEGSSQGEQQASHQPIAPAPPPPQPPAAAPATPAINDETTDDATNVATSSNLPDNTEATVAEVGFGRKGHYDEQNYVTIVVSAQFRAIESLALARIQNAMQQYRALNGQYPKTHEEYWNHIIVGHGIQLPELKPGEKYRYDPKLAEQTRGQQSLTVLQPK